MNNCTAWRITSGHTATVLRTFAQISPRETSDTRQTLFVLDLYNEISITFFIFFIIGFYSDSFNLFQIIFE